MTARIFLIIAIVFMAVSCKRKNSSRIEYKEISQEESVAEAKKAFAESGEKIAVETEIDSFFKVFGRATKSKDAMDVSQFISVDAMLETAEAANAFDGMTAKQKRYFDSGFRKGISKMDVSLRRMAFDRHRIARVEKPAENRRIVFIIFYDNEVNIAHKMRWWLIKTDTGWRAHDYEDLTVGLRSISLMVTMMKAGIVKKPEPWIGEFIPIAQSFQKFDMSDPENVATMREPLLRLQSHNLPLDIRRFASCMLTSAYIAAEEFEKAYEELQASEKGGYRSPVSDYLLGIIMMQREEWNKAIEAFDKYVAILGADSDVLENVSDCHYKLGEFDMAREAALQGLDDNPNSMNCLACLAVASTPEQISDPKIAARFKASGDINTAYENALDYLLSVDELDKARALFAVGRSEIRDDEVIEYYEKELSKNPKE